MLLSVCVNKRGEVSDEADNVGNDVVFEPQVPGIFFRVHFKTSVPPSRKDDPSFDYVVAIASTPLSVCIP